jgi:hypothetical protein
MATIAADIEKRIFDTANLKFNELAGDIFLFQHENCKVFSEWLNQTGGPKSPQNPLNFLPIALFKTKQIFCGPHAAQIVFESSSTTGQIPSKHHVIKTALYEQSFKRGFELAYGNPMQYSWLCLLPGYLERQNSSLVYMAQHLMQNALAGSGFFLNNTELLLTELTKQQPKILLGVSHALLKLADIYCGPPLSQTIIMETGGMKGKGPELTRQELHTKLKKAFGVSEIHSEYGMTELLSQAYGRNGRFFSPPWMKILIRDTSDPGNWLPTGKTGQICIIDLANVYSCSFIATDDLGRLNDDGSFEVLGRFDHSEVRGCNLMINP